MLNQTKMIAALTTMALCLSACAGSGNSADASGPSSSGSDRLSWQSENINIDRTNSMYAAQSGQSLAITVPLTLTMVATLVPPVVNGTTVFATDVKMSGTKVYVAYNTVGAPYGGGIDVVDTTFPATPTLSSSVQDAAADFSQLLVSGTNLYSVGAMDTGLADSAVVRKYSLTVAGNLVASAPLTQVIPGPTGVGLAADLVNLYTVSGNNGGLSILSPSTLAISGTATLNGVRDVRVNALGGISVLTGKTASAEALVKTYNTSGAVTATSANMLGAVIDEGKSTLATGTILNLATAGNGGTNLICAATGAIANTIAAPTVTGLTAAQTAANAAVFSGGLIFVANGGAGVFVYALQQNDILPSCNVSTNLVGSINFGDGTSVNNVMVSGGYLIAATGAGGFKIVRITQGVVAGLLGAL